MDPKTIDTIKGKLAELFGVQPYSIEYDAPLWEIRDADEGFNLAKMVEAAAILGCHPDKLFFNADVRNEGYCETCSYSYEVLTIEVRE